METGKVEVVKLDSVVPENIKVEGQFDVNTKFNIGGNKVDGIVKIDSLQSNRVTPEQFGNGNHDIKLNVSTGKYQGDYLAGVIVKKNPFMLDSKEPTQDFKEYIKSEIRYNALSKVVPQQMEEILDQAEKFAQDKNKQYRDLAELE